MSNSVRAFVDEYKGRLAVAGIFASVVVASIPGGVDGQEMMCLNINTETTDYNDLADNLGADHSARLSEIAETRLRQMINNPETHGTEEQGDWTMAFGSVGFLYPVRSNYHTCVDINADLKDAVEGYRISDEKIDRIGVEWREETDKAMKAKIGLSPSAE